MGGGAGRAQGFGEVQEGKSAVARFHHPLRVRTPEPRPHLACCIRRSVPRLTRNARRSAARGPRNRFRGAEQYFRESVTGDCSRLGRGAVPPGPCCCEQLGGGGPRPCSWLPGRSPRRSLGVCACAVRPRFRLLPPFLKTLTLQLCAATHLNILEPPSSARYRDPLTLPRVCTPNTFSGRPSERLTSPLPPQIVSRRPSAVETWPSDLCGPTFRDASRPASNL